MMTNQRFGKEKNFQLSRLAVSVALAASSLGASFQAQAMVIETSNPDVKMSWDNTVKYSAAWRVRGIDPGVADNSVGPQINTNDGDLNFKKNSMISNRLDLLSEFDFRFKNKYGFRISGAAWYDDVYQGTNDNPGEFGGAFVNTRSVPFNEFSDAVKNLHGQRAELRDAFVYGNVAAGDTNVNLKFGQFTQLYGESLFFGYNGIAGAQTPLDLVRALSVPNSQFKEIALPVKQMSFQTQVTPNVTVGGYYQFEWKKNRIPAAGSYFSFTDFADDGGETLILGPGAVLGRTQDQDAKDSGQGGFQVRLRSGDNEYGFYAAQFHDKLPQFYARPGVNPGNGFIGDYLLTYGESIKTYGASISTLVGETNVAAELSFRNDQPLVASGVTLIVGPDSNNNSNPAYPVGDTLHLNMSAISVLAASSLWDGASFVGELAYNQRLRIDRNEAALDPSATKAATAIQFVFQPEYFQVMPGVDLQLPIGVGYGISGRSSVAGVAVLMPPEGGGNLSIGVKADIEKTWQAGLNYTTYFGSSGSVIKYNTAVPELSYQNFHGDRDFISISVQRTF